MTTTNWIKIFGKLALIDVRSIPSRLRRHFWATLAVLVGFHFRKAYEEKSLFFRLLFMPLIMIKLISSKIKAHRRGLSLLEFLKLEKAELAAEAEMFRHPSLRTVICNSRMVRDDIARRFGVADEKLQVIYNGVDLEAFHPRLREEHGRALREKIGVGETAPVILFVGSGYERKGLPTLLHALSRMSRNDARLWVIGRDKHETLMRKLAQTLGVDERVLFLGAQADVKPFYGAADVFALPTRYDPFPNAALEALACGLPLVTTTTCGAAELVTGSNGRIVKAGDIEALAAALGQLTAGAAQMRHAARQSVEHLSLDAMAGKLQALYAALISARHETVAAQ